MSQSETVYPQTRDQFNELVNYFKETRAYREPLLFAVGGAVETKGGTLASVRFPVVNGPNPIDGKMQNTGTAAILMKVLGIKPEGVQTVRMDNPELWEILRHFDLFKNDSEPHPNIDVLRAAFKSNDKAIATFIFDDMAPQGVEDSTLKLYALSNRLFKPNTLDFSKIFTKLPNVAWQNDTPMDSDEIEELLMRAAFDNGEFAPQLVDKFPLYVHRINALKMGVRITDQYKVRLGAYLGEGTTVMPGASFVNYNAGCAGPNMIEGRVSSGVFLGEGTDLGGGASTVGGLSGDGSAPPIVGMNCLLEVHSTLNISIGNAVIIAANTAVLPSSMVYVNWDKHCLYGQSVKAIELSDIDGVTFRRNDTTGLLEMVQTTRNLRRLKELEEGKFSLNPILHKN